MSDESPDEIIEPEETEPEPPPIDPEEFEALKRRYSASSQEGRRLAQELAELQTTFGFVVDLAADLARNNGGNGNGHHAEPEPPRIEFADDYGRSRDPNWAKDRERLKTFLERPVLREQYQQHYQQSPERALDWAAQTFNYENRLRTAARMLTNREISECAIPGGRSGDSRRFVPESAVQRARRLMRSAPRQAREKLFADAIGSTISDEHLGVERP